MKRAESFKIFSGRQKRNMRADKINNIQAVFNFLDWGIHSGGRNSIAILNYINYLEFLCKNKGFIILEADSNPKIGLKFIESHYRIIAYHLNLKNGIKQI